MKMGIENLTLCAAAVGALVTFGAALLTDGVKAEDIPPAQSAGIALFKLKDLSKNDLIAEVKDLDSDEMRALAKVFEDNFDLKSDSVEQTIEKGIDTLMSVVPFILMILGKKLPA